MARYVICKVCNVRFDREKEEAVPAGGRRYAHAKCMEGYEPSDDEKNLTALHDYLKGLFKEGYSYLPLSKEIEKYLTEPFNYTYTGILKSLVYWYEVKGNSLEKANNRIGIVPYIYEDAKKYYYALYLANLQNIDKDLEEIKQPKIRVVKIKPPPKHLPVFRLFDLDD